MSLCWYTIPPFALEPFEGDEMTARYLAVPAGDHTLHVWLGTDDETAETLAEVLLDYPYILNVEYVPASEGYRQNGFAHYLSVIYEPGELLQARGVIAMHCKHLEEAES